jgi:hypothetical protein
VKYLDDYGLLETRMSTVTAALSLTTTATITVLLLLLLSSLQEKSEQQKLSIDG